MPSSDPRDLARNILRSLSDHGEERSGETRSAPGSDGGSDTHDPLDDIEELSAPGATVFRFDGTQFIYNWQTSKPWANTCRLLVVTLADGTVHTAQFKFK